MWRCGFSILRLQEKTLKKCNFKALEPTVRTDSGKKKDFYKRVCYGSGPGGYPMPDDGSDNETACQLFGKTVVKTASGTIVAPTTCNDGDPYTKANDQACYAAGKTACWKGPSGELAYEFLNLWTVGATNERAKKYYDPSLCWRLCAGADACYGDKANILKNLPESMGCKRAATIVEGSVNAGPGIAGWGALYTIEGVGSDLYCGF
jgi:hypothetical protein